MTESITDHALVARAGALSSSTRLESGPARVLLQTDQLRVLFIDLERGRELPPHRPETNLVLAVLDGMGQLLVDDEIRPVRTGDLAVVRAGVARGLRCLEGRLLALAVVTPPPGPDDHRWHAAAQEGLFTTKQASADGCSMRMLLIFNDLMVSRGGIEPPTRGFSAA